MSSLPALIAERYRPIRLVGRGGGGVVYEVEHVHTGARLALKALSGFENASPETVARFRREARLAAAIDSEHVVRITDAGTAPELSGAPFLVMELMQGRTLESEARAPLAPALVLSLLGQVARALTRAHALGIVHRDLKPDNLFITQREDGSPWVKVLDFGIAKRSGEGSTEQGTVLGTPTYMSPEQAQGQADRVDARTDTWALGLVAFRLLSGRSYFEPDSMLRLLHRVVFEPLPAPSEVGCHISPAFDAWFARACSRDLTQRFDSPIEQLRELSRALEGASVQIEARPEREQAARPDSLNAEDVPGSLSRVAPTPPSELSSVARAGSSRSSAASSVPFPAPRQQRQRWFALGAGLGALLLLGMLLVVRVLSERAPAGVRSATVRAPVAAPSSAVETAKSAAAAAPASLPSAPPLRGADAEEDASFAAHKQAPARERRPAAHALPKAEAEPEPAQAETYDPLGDQR